MHALRGRRLHPKVRWLYSTIQQQYNSFAWNRMRRSPKRFEHSLKKRTIYQWHHTGIAWITVYLSLMKSLELNKSMTQLLRIAGKCFRKDAYRSNSEQIGKYSPFPSLQSLFFRFFFTRFQKFSSGIAAKCFTGPTKFCIYSMLSNGYTNTMQLKIFRCYLLRK